MTDFDREADRLHRIQIANTLTAEQIADGFIDTFEWPFSERIEISATELADLLVGAVRVSRGEIEAL